MSKTTRERYIEAGIIKPSTESYHYLDRAYMSSDCLKALKEKYLKLGIIVPRKPMIVTRGHYVVVH